MTRTQTIEMMVKMVKTMYCGNYSKDLENSIWDICIMWNSENTENEIFMCEHVNDDNVVDGFYIEDDYFLYSDME